jgi:predicted transcriptional regulator
MSTSQTTMGVKIEKSTRARLARLGKTRDRSPHWLVKQAIEDYLRREEAVETMAQEDLERWERFRETGESHSLEEATTLLANLRAGKATAWRR